MDIYRLHKYDPSLFNELGAYTRAEWTHISDIGKMFDGFKLTTDEYLRVENNYVSAIIRILEFFNTKDLQVFSGGNKVQDVPNFAELLLGLKLEEIPNFKNGDWLSGYDIELYCRLCLRDLQDFAMTNRRDLFFLFTGESYVHIGCNTVTKTLMNEIEELGLYLVHKGILGTKDIDDELYELLLPELR